MKEIILKIKKTNIGIKLYGTGPCCSVEAKIRHRCQDTDLGT